MTVVLEQRAVPLIRPRLGDGVDGHAVATELGTVGVGQHLVFGNRFDPKCRAQLPGSAAAVPVVLYVGVVHEEHLSLRAGAGDGVLRLPSEELLELSARGCRRDFIGAWREDDQLRVAAIEKRQLGHLLLLDHRAERHRHRVNDRRIRSDRDRFLHRRRPQRKVHDGPRADDQTDPLSNDRLKSRQRRVDVVRRWQQVIHGVAAL